MKLLVSLISLVLVFSHSEALRKVSTGRPPVCRYARDCDLKDCGDQGPKRDYKNCVLKGCPCKDGFTPPDNSCVCVRAPCPCPVSCPKLTCPVNCAEKNGWALDDKGCNTCSCRPECPEVDCASSCPNGYDYVFDKNGCQMCKCKPPKCGPLCRKFCQFGNVIDENGCPICECKKRPECEPVRCRLGCKNGFDTNEHGCEICKCKPCTPLACDLHCALGFEKDKNGCDICQCVPCLQILCKKPCPHGFATDENGCQDSCKCKCGPVCAIFCPNGNVMDQFGCPTCTCKEEEPQWNQWSRWSSCSGTCGSGTRTRTRTCSDPSGDGELCPGKDSQTEVCQNKRKCNDCRRYRCPRYCSNGHNYSVNSKGCSICSCKPDFEKPGTCPALRQISASSRHFCRKDSNCSGDLKCCRVGPGSLTCIAPVARDLSYGW